MKYVLLIPLALAAVAGTAYAQTIYRCPGNVYTNDAAEARSKGCKTMEGGNITVVPGTRVNVPSAAVKVANAPLQGPASVSRPTSSVRATLMHAQSLKRN
jgi:hypothetical protein